MKLIKTQRGVSEFLTERESYIYTQRRKGVKFRELGERFGITSSRVMVIYRDCIKKLTPTDDWRDGLSIRARNAVSRVNVVTPFDLKTALSDGGLRPGNPREYGKKTHCELLLAMERLIK